MTTILNRFNLFIIFLLLSSKYMFGHDPKHDHNSKLNSQINFIENLGQWNSEAKYKAVIPFGSFYLTEDGFMYNFFSELDYIKIHDKRCGPNAKMGSNLKNEVINMHAYRVRFDNANKYNKQIKSNYRQKAYLNYFLGNDPSKWASKVGMFAEVSINNLYNNIDLIVYTQNEKNSIKYDLVVKPNADPKIIQLSFDGVTPTLDKDGNLIIKTSVNELKESAPYTYQIIDGKEVMVPSKYVIREGKVSFEFPNGYNKNYNLVIDPSLVFYTYSGGSNFSYYSYTSGYDKDGNMYTAGDAWGDGWPVTTGAYQTTYGGGGHDVCIMKISSAGDQMYWASYYGGSLFDLPHSVWVDDNYQMYIAGTTESGNLPMHANAYDNTLGGSWDNFLCKFSADGSQLLGSTYLGGSGIDGQQFTMTTVATTDMNYSSTTQPLQIMLDNNGSLWVVGNTSSTDFPTTSNGQYNTHSGSADGFISKFDANLTTLQYSTLLGGSGNDGLTSIIQQDNNNIVFGGITYSNNLPGVNGVQSSSGGGQDGFVGIINYNTNLITRLTYLGTTSTDHVVNLEVDCDDNVYVLGRTTGNYIISNNVWNVPNGDVFIEKLNSDISTRVLSTRMGNTGGSNFFPSSFLVDVCGRVYVGGFSAQSGLFTTPDAYDVNHKSFYLITFEKNFSDIVYASYFGQGTGDHNHIGSHRLDPDGFFYHTICNFTPFVPIQPIPNVYQPTKVASAGQDILSFKFDFEAKPMNVAGETPEGGNIPNNHTIRGCKSAFLHYTRAVDPEPMIIYYEIAGTAVNGVDYQWIPDSIIIQPNEDSAALEIKGLLSPTATGPKTVIINSYSPCSCDGSSRKIVSSDTVIILDSLYVNIPIPTDTSCPKDLVTIVSDIDPTLDFYWEPANLIQDATGTTIQVDPTVTTTYSITVSQPGAPATCPTRTKSYRAYVEPYPIISFPNDIQTICLSNDSFPLLAYVEPAGINYRYVWSPTTHIRDATTPVNKFYAPVGSYTMKVTISTPGAGCSSTDSMVINVVPPFEFESITPADTTIKLGDKVQINSIGDAVMWYWTPMEFLNDPMIPNPIATPKENTLYRLVGFDKYGCTDTGYVNINVKHTPDIYIPNAFSPNGDGFNDVFKIVNLTYEKLVSFRVYNRLGELVFETQDPNKGWDGTYNGKPAPNDVYFYHIQVTPPLELKPIEFKGDVTLIR